MKSPGIGTARYGIAAGLAAALLFGPGCSSLISNMAVNTLSGVLAEGEAVFRSDDDLGLVEGALANNLKLIETLLQTSPDNQEILLSAAKGFLLYAYGFIEPDLFELDFTQFEEKQRVRRRAARIYRRATDYGLRGLEVSYPGISERLRRDPDAAVMEIAMENAALALWTGTALGARIGMETDNPEATADLSVMGALLHRSRELDDGVDGGVVYDYLSIYETARIGGSLVEAREYYEHALELGPERRPVLWATWAETGSVANGDRQEFETLLQQTLDFDIDNQPDGRLLNRVAKERAAWLLQNVDDYFLDNMPY
jgi:tetratricopeptide (TPR) repeat protein